MDNYLVASYFNEWNDQSKKWLDDAFQQKLGGFVLGSEFSKSVQEEISSKKLEYVPVFRQTLTELDYLIPLSRVLNKRNCLLTADYIYPLSGIEFNKDEILCDTNPFENVYDLSILVTHLEDRSKVVDILKKDIVDRYGNILSARFILGSHNFWSDFIGFQSYVYSKNYLERKSANLELIFNMFVAFAHKNVRIYGHEKLTP
jgi:hypothetical protein